MDTQNWGMLTAKIFSLAVQRHCLGGVIPVFVHIRLVEVFYILSMEQTYPMYINMFQSIYPHQFIGTNMQIVLTILCASVYMYLFSLATVHQIQGYIDVALFKPIMSNRYFSMKLNNAEVKKKNK